MPIRRSDAKVAVLLYVVPNLLIGITTSFSSDFDIRFFNCFLFLETNRMITISKLYLLTSLGVDFSFWPIFCSKASHRQNCALRSRTNLKISGRV